jgi:hypothetical protein
MVLRVEVGRTPELSDAGGPARSDWQLSSPARVRSSDLVRRSHVCQHPETSELRQTLEHPKTNGCCLLFVWCSQAAASANYSVRASLHQKRKSSDCP